ncbi:MAG: hypothetical protein IKQ05_04395 [Prevotella sp.]|jgi:hypothetical protein|nr:hypothetical protein [Prevotella sp.]
MRQLSSFQNAIFLVGALLMVIGAGVSLTGWVGAPYVYSLGALAFASMQMLQRYEGTNVTIRRLRRIMLLSDVLFLVSGVLMFASQDNPLGLPHITYLQYVHNKWVGTLLMAALIQLYVVHRLDHELRKEAKKR